MTDTTTPRPRHGANPNRPHVDLNDAATELVLTYGPLIFRDARRYSACAADAEDAYQRALVIMLTKAPSTDPKILVPWLRTVVRREAIEIARARGRAQIVSLDDLGDVIETTEALPEEAAEDAAESELGVEVLHRLTNDQARCLLAYADGSSYNEIAELTGFTARKVTRCITDGRKAFANRLTDIESGSECERMEPLLQRMADGDSYAHVEARPHLRNCAGCRATLRAYREAPSKLAAFFPVALIAPAAAGAVNPPDASLFTALSQQLSSLWNDLQERFLTVSMTVSRWFEIGAAKKFGAAALAAAALTAGGVAVTHGVSSDGDRVAASDNGVRFTGRLLDRIQTPPVKPRTVARTRKPRTVADSKPAPAPAKPAPPPAAAPIDNGSGEFLPEAR